MTESARKKKQRFRLFGAVIAIISIVVFGLWVSDTDTRTTPEELRQQRENSLRRDYSVDSSDLVSDSETWIARSEQRFAMMERENQELQSKLDRMIQKLDYMENEKQTTVEMWSDDRSVIGQSILPKGSVDEEFNDESSTNSSSSRLPPISNMGGSMEGGVGYYGQPQQGQMQPQVREIKVYDFTDHKIMQEEDQKNVTNYIPAGAFSTVVLLSGLDAPTGGQGMTNPVPVLLRVMDMGQLPNYFNSGIQDCHMIGAGYGELSSERANIRLEKMSCVLRNGNVMEANLNGYLTGEDGKAGLRGRLVSKQGAVIAKALLAGMASGMGESINSQYSNISTSALGAVQTMDSNKVVQSGLAKGASNALEKIADFYIARANEMYPIIEVDANRIGEAILTSGAKLEFNLIGTTRTGMYDE